MAHINQINVNGTDYDIVQAGGVLPIICEIGTADSSYTQIYQAEQGAQYGLLGESEVLFGIKRTGTSGNYSYSLVALLSHLPTDKSYDAPQSYTP